MKHKHPNPNPKLEGPIIGRVMGMLAALVFAAPTAMLLWWLINIALGGDTVVSPHVLVGMILTFAVIALAMPNVFPSMLVRIWRAIGALYRWWF